jgi:hypothetical protein
MWINGFIIGYLTGGHDEAEQQIVAKPLCHCVKETSGI